MVTTKTPCCKANFMIWFKRIQYTFLIIACTAFLFVQVEAVIRKFLRQETGTRTLYFVSSEVDFPDLSICPSVPYKESELKKNGIESIDEYRFNSKWSSNTNGKSPEQIYKEVVIDSSKIVNSLKIFLENEVNGSTLQTLKPEDKVCSSSESLFVQKEYYFNGECSCLVMPSCLSKAGPLEIELEFNVNVHIFIHHKGQFLSPNSRTRAFGSLGRKSKFSVGHEVVSMLPKKSNCIDERNFDYDECMFDELYKLLMEKVGCTVPWLTKKNDICKEEEKSKLANMIYQENRRNQEGICPNSCNFTEVILSPPIIEGNQDLQVATTTFYFKKDIRTIHEYVLFTEGSMMAEIGGLVGVILGVSFVNVGSIVNKLLDYCRE